MKHFLIFFSFWGILVHAQDKESFLDQPSISGKVVYCKNKNIIMYMIGQENSLKIVLRDLDTEKVTEVPLRLEKAYQKLLSNRTVNFNSNCTKIFTMDADAYSGLSKFFTIDLKTKRVEIRSENVLSLANLPLPEKKNHFTYLNTQVSGPSQLFIHFRYFKVLKTGKKEPENYMLILNQEDLSVDWVKTGVDSYNKDPYYSKERKAIYYTKNDLESEGTVFFKFNENGEDVEVFKLNEKECAYEIDKIDGEFLYYRFKSGTIGGECIRETAIIDLDNKKLVSHSKISGKLLGKTGDFLFYTKNGQRGQEHVYRKDLRTGGQVKLEFSDIVQKVSGLKADGRIFIRYQNDLSSNLLSTSHDHSLIRIKKLSLQGPNSFGEALRLDSPNGGYLPSLIYFPDTPNALNGFIIHLHGGGCWADGTKFHVGPANPYLGLMVSKGFATLTMSYTGDDVEGVPRLRHCGHDEVKDILSAFKYLRQRFGQDLKIYLFGWSYGAYLSNLISTFYSDSFDLSGVISVAGVWDFVEQDKLRRVEDIVRNEPNTEPIKHIDKHRVPILIAHGRQDKSVRFENAISFLKAKGPSEDVTSLLLDTDHGFSDKMASLKLLQAIDKFLDSN